MFARRWGVGRCEEVRWEGVVRRVLSVRTAECPDCCWIHEDNTVQDGIHAWQIGRAHV